MVPSDELGTKICLPSTARKVASFEPIIQTKPIRELQENAGSNNSRDAPDFLDHGRNHEVWKRNRGHSISSPIAVARTFSNSSSSTSSSYFSYDKRRKVFDFKKEYDENTSSTLASPSSPSSSLSSSSLLSSLSVPLSLSAPSSIASSSIISKYSGVSRRGFAPHVVPTKKNQDAYLLFQHEDSNSMIFCCMDGHGRHGELCSAYFKNRIEEKLTSHPSFITNIRFAIEEIVAKIEKDMIEDSTIDTEMSGSTLIIAIVRDRNLIVANIGDSRAICGYCDSTTGEIGVERISVDHKPEIESEASRITSAGGRVAAIKCPEGGMGPLRVFLKDAPFPGLAMSRSLGDTVAHKVGVISEPEFFERELLVPDDILLIVATDGLWQYMDDLECVEICCNRLKYVELC